MKTRGDKISISLGLFLSGIAFLVNSDIIGAAGMGLLAGGLIKVILD